MRDGGSMTDLNKERELYMAAKARIEKEEFFCRDWDLWKACAELKQAEINELRAELEKAKAQAVPTWISVEDRLPNEGEEVVVHHFGHVVQATKDKNYVGGFKQRNCYGWESVSSYISHWMPKNFKLPDTFSMYYTDENPYKETVASESGAKR